MATAVTSLLQRLAARWIDTPWRAIQPCDLRGECLQALPGTDHDGGLLIIERAAIGMAGHTEMRARAMLVFSADVALAYVAREHKDLFGLAEESCLTPPHRQCPAAHTGSYGWAMAAATCIAASGFAFAERRRCSSCICSSARPVAAAMMPSAG